MHQIDIVPRSEWPTLARFIHEHNRRPDGRVRCLHAEQGRSVDEQVQEMLALPEGEACFVAAREGSAWLGAMGCEIDPALKRAWLRGPLTHASDAPDAAPLRAALIDALEAALPEVRRFDAFAQVGEASLRASYRAAGYRELHQYHVMSLPRPASVPAWPADVHEASAAEAPQAARLHEALFPETYLSVAAMLASLDADHRLLVATRDGAVAGYLYVQHKPLEREGYVDFLGVAEAARGHGLGRALLNAAVHWAMETRGLPKVSLTVRQSSAPALGLYESAGFREVAAGAHMIRERAAG